MSSLFKSRHIPAAVALTVGIALLVFAWPRFVGGAIIAPDEDLPRKLARDIPVSQRQIDAAREEATVSARWFVYGKTLNFNGALELIQASRAKSAPDQRAALAKSQALLRAGLMRTPADSCGWMQLAQATRALNGATPALNSQLRMSLRTAPFEHRLIIPRLDVAFKSWNALSPDLKAAMTGQILRAVDTAPRALARATRRNFALRQVRQAVETSEIHKRRFDIVYSARD